MGFPGGTPGEESSCQHRRCKEHRFNPWVRKIPWRRKWQPTPVFLAGKSHGQRSLAGYNPWGGEELDTTEHKLTWRTAGLRQFSTDHKLPLFPQKNQSFTYLAILEEDVADFSCYASMRFVGPSFNCSPCSSHHHSIWTHTGPSPWEDVATYKSFLFCYISSDILMFLVHWYPDFSGPLWFHVTKG